MSEYKIVKTVELSGMPNPALAKDLLERLRLATAKVVENRKWRVPVLKEFYPKNRSLLGLNVNRGKSIMIRLRDGNDQMSFLPWESVLGTLVHELTHNEIGEHSAEFYKMMEKVYDEVDGSTPSAGGLWGPRAPTQKYLFDGKSATVGGGSLALSAGIASTNVRLLAAEAAMRRIGQSSSNAETINSRVGTKTRKELFLEAEEKRRLTETRGGQGCSIVKPPLRNEFQVHSSTSKATLNSSSADCNWVCQVCMEDNVWATVVERSSSSAGQIGRVLVDNSSVCCVWCGCAYGSSLPGDSVDVGAFRLPSTAAASSGEIFCIDCDSPAQNKRTKPRIGQFVDLVNESGASVSSSTQVGQRRSGHNRVESVEVLCQWTHLAMRGCPCCAQAGPSTEELETRDTKIGVKRKPLGSVDDVIVID